MRLLARKLRRDLLEHWTQFVSVLLMSMLSVTVYAGLEGAWRGMQIEIAAFADEHRMPDGWITAVATTENDVEALRALPGVVDISRSTTFSASNPRPDGTGTLTVLTIDDPGTGERGINRPLVTAGDPVSTDGGGVWLDSGYARANGIRVGDAITLARPGATASTPVRGLVLIPDTMALTGPGLIAPEPGEFAAALVSPETATDALGAALLGNTLRIVGDLGEVRTHAPEILGERYLGFADRESNAFVATVYGRVDQIRGVSVLFSSLFVLVALLAMVTSVRRLIDIQRTEIATLKALGFLDRSIGLYFAALASIVVGIGVIVGLAVAPAMSLYVLETQKTSFELPTWAIAYSWTTPALAVGLIAICTLAAWSVTAGARALTPAEGMRPGTGRSHRVALERARTVWSRVGFGERWAIRDAAGNRIRVIVGIIACAGCMMLLTAGFGIPDSLWNQVQRGYEEQFRYRDWIEVAPGATAEQRAELAEAAGPGQWVMQRPTRLEPDEGVEYVLTVIARGDLFVATDAAGREIDLGSGAAITQRLAADTGLGIGDPIAVQLGGGAPLRVSVEALASISQPQGVLVSEQDWVAAGGTFSPTAYLTERDVDAASIAQAPAAASHLTLAHQRANAESVIVSLEGIFTLMKVFAILLAVVSLYNLGALSFSERERDYATLRVLGFRNGELRALAFTENALTSLLGWLVGIPAGLWFLDRYTAIFSDARAVYAPFITPASLVAASAITLFFAMTATLLLSRRVRRIDMTSALKGVE